jgi:hypothetical protein
MASRPVLRVGGVPEHFNYPWHIAQSRGLFDKHGVDVQWTDVKEGTGQLITNVRMVYSYIIYQPSELFAAHWNA